MRGFRFERDVGETISQPVGEWVERAECTASRQLRDHVAMHAGRDGPTEQGVADAGGRIGEVAHDAPPSVGVADDIDGIVGQPASVRSLAERGEAVVGAAPQCDMIDDRVAEQGPSAVEVVEDRLEHPHPGDRAVGECDELVAVDHERHRVEPPRARFERDHATVTAQRQVVHDVA